MKTFISQYSLARQSFKCGLHFFLGLGNITIFHRLRLSASCRTPGLLVQALILVCAPFGRLANA